MKDISDIKTGVSEMAAVVLKMLDLTHSAFMEHDRDLISSALEEENKINSLEKTISKELVEFGKTFVSKTDRQKALHLAEIVGDLELIGDYCKDILERIEIKIEEKLLFSDDAVGEYNNFYSETRAALADTCLALEKWDLSLAKKVIQKEQELKLLAERYRNSHNQRLLDGKCVPIACNMFLNMLDFTAAIFYRTKDIAGSLLKIK